MKFRKKITNKHIIVAIDIALNTSGVAVMGYNEEVYSTFLIKSTLSWRYYKKLDYLYEIFSEVFLKIANENPKSVILVLEDRLKAGFSGATLASIEGARVTSYHAFIHTFKASHIKTSVVLYDPGTVKKYFSGSRNAKKETVLKSASEKYPFLKKYKQEDVLDALYLGLYYVNNK
jgi:Holliday junction resolvasome RuvABC endonuclease subunit